MSGPRAVARRYLSEEHLWPLARRYRALQRPLLKLRALGNFDLDALAKLHGTDKSSWGHGYATLYQRHFGSRRRTVNTLLEIGVGGISSLHGYETPAGGQSLAMWSRYFPHAHIIGVDIHAKAVGGSRISFEQGDQADPNFLQSLIDKYGQFDIVVDDGSHVGKHIIASMEALWDAVVPGGFYVIEDLDTAYSPDYGGGPPGTPGTAAALIKEKVDATIVRDAFRPPIAAMHIYSDIVFFEKAS